MKRVITSTEYFFEMSIPLWQDALLKQADTHAHKYSAYKVGVAYCASCGMTLDYEEGRESYE